MRIREFSERDIDEITSLMKNLCKIKEQEFNEQRWRATLKQRMNEDSNSEVVVAFDEESDIVLGMAHFSVMNSDKGFKFGYISNLIVKEEKRRGGVGEEIIRYILEYFKANHIQSIRLALKPNLDTAAKILFKKLGFQEMLHIYELKI